MRREIVEFDVFFLSYDEPNCEINWSDLVDKCHWAKRVHGVKGFDSAHRRCAEQSETPWFVTVDGDTIVEPAFFDVALDLDEQRDRRRCFSWNGYNVINGLMYGNGGLKLWSREFVLSMNTHENADDPRKVVDFCWEDNYERVPKTYSEVRCNATPYQAFRVGLREGVKLSLDRGTRVPPELMKSHLHAVNLRNLRIWACVGADAENGLWAIYGTRMGWYAMTDLGWDHSVIRDYDWFDAYWHEEVSPRFSATVDEVRCPLSGYRWHRGLLEEQIGKLGQEIEERTQIAVPYLTPKVSAFFRDSYRFRND